MRAAATYTLTEPCVKGHFAPRYVSNKTCCECAKGHRKRTTKEQRQRYTQNRKKRLGDRYAAYQKDKVLRTVYGMDLVRFKEMMDAQNGCCAICGVHHSTLKKGLHVDHDHETGKVRKLLCARCNTTLGKVGDNVPTLERMIAYLKEHA